jgi:hypothetical protein
MNKISQIFFIIITSLLFLVGSYFLYRYDSHLEKQNLIEQKMNCLNHGREVYGESTFDESFDEYWQVDREYYFNTKLNTCLMYVDALNISDDAVYKLDVIDIFNGKSLLSYSSLCNEAYDYDETKCTSYFEFQQQKEELFSN